MNVSALVNGDDPSATGDVALTANPSPTLRLNTWKSISLPVTTEESPWFSTSVSSELFTCTYRSVFNSVVPPPDLSRLKIA